MERYARHADVRRGTWEETKKGVNNDNSFCDE